MLITRSRLSDGRKCAVALGNFDGVHLGHRRILDACRALAAERELVFAVWTFSRHPAEAGKCPSLLTLPEEKERLLAKAGVEILVTEDFSAVRDFSPEDFCRKILKEGLCAREAVCGFDFRFGKGAEGTAEDLRRLAEPLGIRTTVIEAVRDEAGEKISSTAVRAALEAGDPARAARLLGRPWSVVLPVSHGKRLGRALGFPTINQIWDPRLVSPRRGVYAVTAEWEGGKTAGVCDFGVAPSAGERARACETHLFDFSGDLYGKDVRIAFHEFLREERTFENLEELKRRIACDSARAKAYFAERTI